MTAVRRAEPDDVPALRALGAAVVPATYAPIAGAAFARELLATWWTTDWFAAAVAGGTVLVAVHSGTGTGTDGGTVVGVAEHGLGGHPGDGPTERVLWKLYVHPDHQGVGVGRALLDAVPGAGALWTEHVAGNAAAARWYAGRGFLPVTTQPGADGPGTVWLRRP